VIALNTLFYALVVIFAIIGFLRGWSKELLVTFSLVLGIFVITVVFVFITLIKPWLDEGGPSRHFAVRAAIMIFFGFFGYQVPKWRRISDTLMREKIQDSLLGVLVGAINGYFLFGSLLFYLNQFEYPFSWVTPPSQDLLGLLAYMPPAWLGIPAVYFAVAVAFTLVVVVVI
jgi:uncharacterized membrane protein required for colicin V production